MSLTEVLNGKPLIFDGAMGTMLQAAGLPVGELPEIFNITAPHVVEDIHRAYVNAGADVVSTNTFGANEHKLEGCGYTTEEIISAAVNAAKRSGARFVALDIGPIGQLLEPIGTLSFDDAYDIFARQIKAGAHAGADMVIIETMSDLYEAKAALLAVKENSSLPAIISMTYQEDGRTFVGCDPVGATLTLCALGADAVGVNCSLGPNEMLDTVKTILNCATVPVIVQANAGLPTFKDGETVFPVSAEEYGEYAAQFAKLGVAILGGCCGTSPDYIRSMCKAVDTLPLVKPVVNSISAAVSGTRVVYLDNCATIIGERINPTGKKKLQRALREENYAYIYSEAIDQVQAGADILDVNVGLPELDEAAVMRKIVRGLLGTVDTPLQIDSSNPSAIEAGCRLANGRPIINSVNGKADSMETIFPIAKKYGALVVGLTLDESGIPATAEERFKIAQRIVNKAAEYGIPAYDILIDCLVLTASAQQEQVIETLRAIRMVKAKLAAKTVLGVSNVSFGLPQRELLNATFLAAALGAGLDTAIVNPLAIRYQEVFNAFRVFNNEDAGSAKFIEHYTNQTDSKPALPTVTRDLQQIILAGRRDEAAPAVKALLKDNVLPLEIVNNHFVPALNKIGERFERGEIFLPQLMQSADAVKNGFEVIREHTATLGTVQESRGRILLATVEGDIHDIGKNIVRMMLENYSYDVIDLGKDVAAQDIVNVVREHNVRLVGLSALMTTTVQNMKKTIALCRKEKLACSFMVGGAVLNEEYKEYVGADFYAKDALQSVEIANNFFKV